MRRGLVVLGSSIVIAASTLLACTVMNGLTLPDAIKKKDGSTGDAKARIDGGPCDRKAPFTSMTPLTLNTANDEESPRLTVDELSLFYFSVDFNTNDSTSFFSTRPATDRDFAPATPLLANIKNIQTPSIATDGVTLHFSVFGDVVRMYVAQRAAPDGPFGTPRELKDASDADYSYPRLVTVGGRSQLYYARQTTQADLWVSDVAADGSLSGDHAIDELNSANNEYEPTLSSDGLTIYFYSEREANSTDGHGRIFVAYRDSIDEKFSEPAVVEEIEIPNESFTSPGFLTSDNCRLYYGAGGDMFVARR